MCYCRTSSISLLATRQQKPTKALLNEQEIDDDSDEDAGTDPVVVQKGLEAALEELPKIRQKFWDSVYLPGTNKEINQSLERAGRVADFLEFGEIMIRDALARDESCGCHLREESQTEENEAKRDDVNFSHVSVWEHVGEEAAPVMHKEQLTFEFVTPSQRSYK